METSTILLALLVPLSALGCEHRTSTVRYELIGESPQGWHLTADDAVLIATEHCEQSGLAHIRLGPPAVIADSLDGENFWFIGYHRNSRIPGDHISLLINDATKKIEVEGGQ